jgi:Ser/Thr protein kinase RdoA (MazF antagonist)
MAFRLYPGQVHMSPLPVEHSLLVVAPLTNVIAAAYGFTPPVRITLLRSWTNDVYTLSHEDGNFILKLYRASWRRAADVEWEVQLQVWLHAHGACMTSVIPLHTGELFGSLSVPEGTRCFALFSRAEGWKPVSPFSSDLYYQYGRGSALLHQSSEGFSSRIPRFERSLANLIDASLVKIQPWLEARLPDWQLVQRVAMTVRDHLISLTPGLDWGVCHGDLSLDNLHVRADGGVTFYDLDSACYGWREWDVCNALGYASPENRDAFHRGYRDIRSFHSDVDASVPYFVAADVLRMMGDEVSHWSAWFGTWRVDAWVDEKLAWLREWDRANPGRYDDDSG